MSTILDDVIALKKLLEPEADKAIDSLEMMRDLAILSAAISLKRIADTLEKKEESSIFDQVFGPKR